MKRVLEVPDMHDDDDFTPLTPEEDAALDRLLEPLRRRRKELEPLNDRLSLEDLTAYAQLQEGAWLPPDRIALIEECCTYFMDTRYLVEAIQHPDPRLTRAFYAGINKARAAAGEPPMEPTPEHARLIASISDCD